MIFHPLAALLIATVLAVGAFTLVAVPIAMFRQWYREVHVHAKAGPYVTGTYHH